MFEKLQAEVLDLVKANSEVEAEGGALALSQEKAAAIVMMFVKRECQKVSAQSRGSVLLGVSSQILAGSYAASGGHGPIQWVDAVAVAQRLIEEVREQSAKE